MAHRAAHAFTGASSPVLTVLPPLFKLELPERLLVPLFKLVPLFREEPPLRLLPPFKEEPPLRLLPPPKEEPPLRLLPPLLFPLPLLLLLLLLLLLPLLSFPLKPGSSAVVFVRVDQSSFKNTGWVPVPSAMLP